MQSRLVLDALNEYASKLPTHPDLGQATMHCGTIRGGEENSSYPAECILAFEFRTVPGQSSETIREDIQVILDELAAKDLNSAKPRILFERLAYSLDREDQFLHAFMNAASSIKDLKPGAGAFWCDAALLGEKGIPTVVFGPSGEGLHGKDEYVEVDSIYQVDNIIEQVITQFCG